MPTGLKRTITTSLPEEELAAIDRVRERQAMSRAESVRAAIRWYVGALGNLPPAEDMSPDEVEAIRDGEAEFARGETRRLEDVQNELGLPVK